MSKNERRIKEYNARICEDPETGTASPVWVHSMLPVVPGIVHVAAYLVGEGTQTRLAAVSSPVVGWALIEYDGTSRYPDGDAVVGQQMLPFILKTEDMGAAQLDDSSLEEALYVLDGLSSGRGLTVHVGPAPLDQEKAVVDGVRRWLARAEKEACRQLRRAANHPDTLTPARRGNALVDGEHLLEVIEDLVKRNALPALQGQDAMSHIKPLVNKLVPLVEQRNAVRRLP